MRQKPFSPEEFKQIYSQVPKLTVEVIIRTEDGGVVLSLRKHESWNNQWHIPGCTLFYKEWVEDAIFRVAKEELGVEVKKEQFLGYIEYYTEEKERGFGWSVGLVFLCSTNQKLPEINEEGEKIGIFHQIPENTVVEQKEMLNKVLSLSRVSV